MILLMLAFASSTLIDVTFKCPCKQLVFEQDCAQNSYCYWKSDECVDVGDCSSIQSSVKCTERNICAFFNGLCTNFISCSNYQGSKSDCEEISQLCTSVDGLNCIDRIKPGCETYSKDDCDDSIGPEGECIWLNNKCQILEKCSDIDIGSNILKCHYNAQSCEPEDGKCVDKKCSHFKTNSDCKYLHSYDPKDIPKTMQVCKWDGGQCLEAAVQDLDQDQCYEWLQKSFHWVPALQQCTACTQPPDPLFQYIVKLFIVLFIIIQ